MKQIGRFYYNDVKGTLNYVNPTLAQRLSELAPKVDDVFLDTMLLPLINQTAKVSLRVLDWCCVNYAKKHQLAIQVGSNRTKCIFYIHDAYKRVLRARRRRLFDPFQRKARIFFRHREEDMQTTVAQLAFLLWARDNGVYRYTLKHAHKIEMDMRNTLKANRQKRKKKRQVLTKERKNWLVVSTGAVYYDNSDEES